MKNSLNEIDRQQLEVAYRAAVDKRTANKINILLLIDDGYSHEEVASILRLDESTICRHEKAYRTGGLSEYLKNLFSGGVCKLDAQQIVLLENYLDENLCETTAEVICYVQSEFEITYTSGGMSALLRRLGFVFKKPIIIPGKCDPALQEAFVEYYELLKLSMGDLDKMYFVDGVHPQFNTVAGFGWIRKGHEKRLRSNTGRRRVNLNGALDPVTHEVIIRADESLNSQSTIDLFKMIEAQNPDARKIVLFVDNAPYYYNGDVVDYANKSSQLELVYLPPYAPNLNLIERLWRFMKKKALRNIYHETFDDFKKTLGDFFKNLPSFCDELDDLLTDDFEIVGS
jgi:transposase